MFKNIITPALAASIALVALTAPASAQVNGIGVAEPPVIVASSQALQTGFQQISTTYAAQRTTLEQLQTQRNTLIATFDTNGDGQIDDAEAVVTEDATNPTVLQIQGVDQQISQTQQPIQIAQLYVVSQVAEQYAASVQQVVADLSVQLLLSPEAVVYGPEADLSEEITAVLNTRLPTVSITAPADWQPGQTTVQLYQQIQQVLLMARAQQQQAAQAAAATTPAATEGR